MFNTSFLNKTQLIFFFLLGRTRFNLFLALDRTRSGQNSEECLHCSREQWRHTLLFSDSSHTRSSKMLLLQNLQHNCKINGSYHIKYFFFFFNQTIVCVALPNFWWQITSSKLKDRMIKIVFLGDSNMEFIPLHYPRLARA
jgi:hypothetical protein